MEGIPMSEALSKASREWKEFFQPAAGNRILPLFMLVAQPAVQEPAALVNSISKATILVSADKLVRITPAAAPCMRLRCGPLSHAPRPIPVQVPVVSFDALTPILRDGAAWPAFGAFRLLSKLLGGQQQTNGGLEAAGLAVESVEGVEGAFHVSDLALVRLRALWDQVDYLAAHVAEVGRAEDRVGRPPGLADH